MLDRNDIYKNYDNFKWSLQNPNEFKKDFISEIEKEIDFKKSRLSEGYWQDKKDLELMQSRLKEIESIKINEVENGN